MNNDHTKQYVGEEQWFFFVSKRTERLAAALYMVSDLMSDMEPIKWTSRDRMINLVSDVNAFKGKTIGERSFLIDRGIDTASELISLISVSEAGKIISPMNAGLMREELINLKSFLEEGKMVKTPAERFVSDLFEENTSLPAKGQIKDTMQGISEKRQVEKSLPKQIAQKKTKQISSSVMSLGDDKGERQRTILSVIRTKKEVSIKDIADVVSGCSEKTIQRDLSDMVKKGILKKEGEKRWSRYSLVS